MITQLTIFSTGIYCHYCKADPGRKEGSDVVWNGFVDKDNGLHCCWHCRQQHYQAKSHTDQRHQYSEFPVIVNP